jgi:drug/metabolite transporter (DMT)-like permease
MFISLKLISIKGLDKYLAITVNYAFAMLFTGIDLFLSDGIPEYSSKLILPSLFVGLLFVTSFVAMTFSAERAGIGLTTAFNKMSVIIPVSIGVLYLGQEDGLFLKITGILIALTSFYLILYKRSEKRVKGALTLPLIVFLLSGAIDSSMELTNTFIISESSEGELFLFGVFVTAAICGAVAYIVSKRGERELNEKGSNLPKTFIFGSLLGLFNFLTSKMILVNVGLMGGSVVFPVHNASVVMLTSLIGVYFFKERFSKRQWFGVLLAIVSVFMIASTL